MLMGVEAIADTHKGRRAVYWEVEILNSDLQFDSKGSLDLFVGRCQAYSRERPDMAVAANSRRYPDLVIDCFTLD